MYKIIQYGNEAFILFMFPLIGLLLERNASKKQLYWLLAITFVLATPVFASYRYVIPYALRLLVLTFFSAAFAIFINALEEWKYKAIAGWTTSILLFFLFGFFALLDSFAGHQEVEKTWRIGNYKVEYIKDQGFAGGPLLKYELYKYGFIPLFIKKVDIAIGEDSTDNCFINFTHSRMIFNKCSSSLTKSTHK